jgi:ribosome-binding ATPase
MLVGVVGKPNVGKSTFFKAATLAEVKIANYPFATIKPNHDVGYVKVKCAEKFFNVKCNPRLGCCIDGTRFVPIDMVDVAGLVPGAHEGRGMGNQFLNDLNQADVLIHVIDVSGSTNSEGENVSSGSYDPALDVKFLEEELDYWYLGILKKGWEKFSRTIEYTKKDACKELSRQLSAFKVTENIVKEASKKLSLDTETITKWNEEDLFNLSRYLRRKTKPMVIAANKIDLPASGKNIEKLKKEFPETMIIPCSAESELALREAHKKGLIKYIPGEGSFKVLDKQGLNEKQVKALDFIQKNILDIYKTTGVQDTLNKSVFEFLGYMPIFPGGVSKLADKNGNVLPDCFLLPPKSTAIDFAYKIHSDLGDKFIRAVDVKTKMTVGKDHLLKPGDVVEIMANK